MSTGTTAPWLVAMLLLHASGGCGATASEAPAPLVEAGAPDASTKPKPKPLEEVPPTPLACRMIHIDWGTPNKWSPGTRISDYTLGLRHDDGSVAFMTARELGGDVVHMIVDADGPVRQAIRERSTCIAEESQSSGEHYVYTAYDPAKIEGASALGGKLGERPRVLVAPSDGVSHGYVAGAAGVVEYPGMNLHAWADGAPIAKLRPPEDGGLFTAEYSFVGNTVL